MLKVLTLENWSVGFHGNKFKPNFLWPSVDDILDNYRGSVEYEFIEPIIGRNGWYFDRKKNFSWVEVDGQAIQLCPDNFKYKLKLLRVEDYGLYHYEELKNICKTKYASKEQQDLLRTMSQIITLRNIYTSSAMEGISRFRKLKERLTNKTDG